MYPWRGSYTHAILARSIPSHAESNEEVDVDDGDVTRGQQCIRRVRVWSHRSLFRGRRGLRVVRLDDHLGRDLRLFSGRLDIPGFTIAARCGLDWGCVASA